MAFGHSNREDCFRRCLSESGLLTFRVSEESPYTSDISAQEYLSFLSMLRSNWDKLSRTQHPPLLHFFLNVEEKVYISFSGSTLESVVSHS